MKLWNMWAFFSVHCRSIEHFIPVSSVRTKCKLSFFFLDENILRTTQIGSLSLLVVVVLLARNIRRGDQDHLDVDTLGGWHKVSAKESVNQFRLNSSFF